MFLNHRIKHFFEENQNSAWKKIGSSDHPPPRGIDCGFFVFLFFFADFYQLPLLPKLVIELLSNEKYTLRRASLLAEWVKNLPAMQETQVQSLGQGRSPGERNGNPLQYSRLENPLDRGA